MWYLCRVGTSVTVYLTHTNHAFQFPRPSFPQSSFAVTCKLSLHVPTPLPTLPMYVLYFESRVLYTYPEWGTFMWKSKHNHGLVSALGNRRRYLGHVSRYISRGMYVQYPTEKVPRTKINPPAMHIPSVPLPVRGACLHVPCRQYIPTLERESGGGKGVGLNPRKKKYQSYILVGPRQGRKMQQLL